jgi:hypothetical protein
MRCAKCKKSNLDPTSSKFHNVPTYPAPHWNKNPSLDQVAKRQGKILFHEEMMEWVTSSRTCTTVKVYFCEDHDFETVTWIKTIIYNGTRHLRQYVLTGVKIGARMNSSAIDYNTASKQVAHDGAVHKKNEDATLKMLPPMVHQEMAAIHTSLPHEVQSKGKGKRAKLDELHELQVEMLTSDLAVTKIHFSN